MITSVFLLALIITLALKLWLIRRQITHVRAHRGQVPGEFSSRIALTEHHKAADYTVAKMRLAVPALLIDLALVLFFTLGGGLAVIHQSIAPELSGIPYGIALIASVAVLSSLLELPLSFYRQFVTEARFGFNRMTIGLFIGDLLKQALLGAALQVLGERVVRLAEHVAGAQELLHAAGLEGLRQDVLAIDALVAVGLGVLENGLEADDGAGVLGDLRLGGLDRHLLENDADERLVGEFLENLHVSLPLAK